MIYQIFLCVKNDESKWFEYVKNGFFNGRYVKVELRRFQNSSCKKMKDVEIRQNNERSYRKECYILLSFLFGKYSRLYFFFI